jgi:hypothetical protein
MDELKEGDRVYLLGDHPWADHVGTLIAEEQYGPMFNRKTGWRIELDSGQRCYAQPSQFSRVAAKGVKKPISIKEAVRKARGDDAPTYRGGHA